MIPRFGVDASILLRMITAHPSSTFRAVRDRLVSLVRETDAAVFASNHVIGETYLALVHCYGVDRQDARTGIRSVLTSGLIAPIGGTQVTAILAEPSTQLVDRLIVNHYARQGLRTLTQDEAIGHLDGVLRLRPFVDPLDQMQPYLP